MTWFAGSRSRSPAGTGVYHLLLGVSSIAPSRGVAPAFRPLVPYKWIRVTMSVYKRNAMLRPIVSATKWNAEKI